MTDNKMREAFEEIHGAEYGHVGGGIVPASTDPWQHKSGIYRSRSVQDRWIGFQWACDALQSRQQVSAMSDKSAETEPLHSIPCQHCGRTCMSIEQCARMQAAHTKAKHTRKE